MTKPLMEDKQSLKTSIVKKKKVKFILHSDGESNYVDLKQITTIY